MWMEQLTEELIPQKIIHRRVQSDTPHWTIHQPNIIIKLSNLPKTKLTLSPNLKSSQKSVKNIQII